MSSDTLVAFMHEIDDLRKQCEKSGDWTQFEKQADNTLAFYLPDEKYPGAFRRFLANVKTRYLLEGKAE